MTNTQTLAERLESALRDGGWKPIETAPKDGTWFLTKNDSGKVWTCNHPENHMRGQWHRSTLYADKRWVGHGDIEDDNPIYWHVLPSEPDPLLTLIRELMEVVRRQEEVIKKGADFCFADALDKTCSSQDAARLWLPVKRAFKQTLAETAPLLAAMEKN